MNLLLDTHILLWWLEDSPRLSPRGRQAIEQADAVFASAVSAWEISMKVARGNLEFNGDFDHQVELNNFTPLPMTAKHAWLSGALPRIHGDPFDRMLVAQAQGEALTLLTVDKQQAQYGIPVILA